MDRPKWIILMRECPPPPLRGGLVFEAQFKNNHFTEMCSGSEAGSYLRLMDSCTTQLKAQGPSRTCNESKEEEEEAIGLLNPLSPPYPSVGSYLRLIDFFITQL